MDTMITLGALALIALGILALRRRPIAAAAPPPASKRRAARAKHDAQRYSSGPGRARSFRAVRP